MPAKNNQEDIIKIINSEENYMYSSGVYNNNKSKLTIKHLVCNTEFLIDYDHWKRGQRCPNCNKSKQKYSNEQFLKKLEEVQPSKYTVLSQYKTKRQNVKVKCNECNNIFESLPGNLYNR